VAFFSVDLAANCSTRSDVRRTVLYNLTPTPTTFEYFIERARDIDISTRRAVFRRLLTTFDDFRLMSLVLRENLLSWGFNDADKSVRLAAKKVFSYRWLKDAEGDVLELLERLDVVSEGVEQGSKYTAMMGFWEERGDLLSTIDLNSHEFWENLTPESSFLARTFNDYYRSISSPAAAAIVEARLPELSKMTDYLKKYMNKYIVMWQDPGIQESSADLEFTIMQLLKITCSMDFSDEVGRRRLFALLRECLGVEEMSGPITVLVCDGVRKLSHGEYDFSLIVVEAIAQIRQIIIDTRQERETKKDSDDDSASFHTANDDIEHGNADLAGQNAIGLSTSNRRKTGDYFGFDDTNLMEEVDQAFEENQRSVDPAVVVRELSLNLKCLHLAQCVLERVKATNGDLFSMIPTCVVPAVRSHAPLAREGGIRCLGLFGILDIV
jgi:condensin complex subunit 3